MIATCNSIDALSPEILARFRTAKFFFDYPTAKEQAQIWKLKQKSFGLADQPLPPSRNWVGREIEACCENAFLFDTSLMEAAETIVPGSVTSSGKLEALRKGVSGRYLSAAKRGLFTTDETATTGNRRIES